MPFMLIYLFKLSLSLGVVLLFYQVILRKLTFYNWNRWWLLFYTLLCFFIPFIDISPVLQRNDWTSSTAVTWIPVMGEYKANEIDATPPVYFFTAWNIISLVLVAGMLVMACRLLIQLISFRKMMKKAIPIPGEGMNLFQVDEEIIPFSFGNSIFINQRLHKGKELQEIIRHEFVHVKQKHSIDIIWSELLCLLNWYNPFAWLLKRCIRQNLEFIADSKVLENGINKKEYQYLLLKVIGNSQFSFAQKFNFSSLKKRIAMMNKLKTAKLHLVRFLFILPLLAVILLSFRKQIGDSITQHKNKGVAGIILPEFTDTVPDVLELNDKGYYIDIKGNDGNYFVVVKDRNRKEVERVLLTKWKEKQQYYDDLYGEILPPPPSVPPVPPAPPAVENDPGIKAFLKRNADVKSIGWSYENKNNGFQLSFRINKKDGTTEIYNLDDETEKAKVIKKYGELPLPPPPPPPPLPPTKATASELDAVREVNLSNISEDFEITDRRATLKLKNGTIEKYDLTKPDQRTAFENKYGKIISTRASTSAELAPVAVINGSSEQAVIAPLSPVVASTAGRPFIVDDNGYIITGKEDILVTITKKTTPQQLEEYIKQMKEKGIELKFDDTEFDKGVLKHISGTIKFKDSQGNFSATDFNKLILAMVKEGEHIYFRVDEQILKKRVVI